MSLYSDYLIETEQREIIEADWGFITFQIMGTECYIIDVYVSPDHRRTGGMTDLATEVEAVAREKGCKLLTGSVNTSIKDPTRSISALIAYGMKFLKAEPHILWFGKELS